MTTETEKTLDTEVFVISPREPTVEQCLIEKKISEIIPCQLQKKNAELLRFMWGFLFETCEDHESGKYRCLCDTPKD